MSITITCQACGTKFIAERSTRKYCSDACRYRQKQHKHRRLRVPDALRWQIMKRDAFTCRYCGGRAGEAIDEGSIVELRIDHVVPVELGGKMLNADNLVTACHRCNNGKSDENLDPQAVPPPPTVPHPDPPHRVRTGPRRRLRGTRG